MFDVHLEEITEVSQLKAVMARYYDSLSCETKSKGLIKLAHLFFLLDKALCSICQCSHGATFILQDNDASSGKKYTASIVSYIDSGGFGAVFGCSQPVELGSGTEQHEKRNRKFSEAEQQWYRGIPSCALKLGITEHLVNEMENTPQDEQFPLTRYSLGSTLPLGLKAHLPQLPAEESQISCMVSPLGIPWKANRIRVLMVNNSAWKSLLEQIIAGHEEKNVCHRDVRRNNLLLVVNNRKHNRRDVLIEMKGDRLQRWCRVKLIDWECAQKLGEESECYGSPETRPRRLLNTRHKYTPRVEDSVEQLLLTLLTVVAGRSPEARHERAFWEETIEQYKLTLIKAALDHIDERHASGYSKNISTRQFYAFIRKQLSLLPVLAHDKSDSEQKRLLPLTSLSKATRNKGNKRVSSSSVLDAPSVSVL